jgi:hypothetical protein
VNVDLTSPWSAEQREWLQAMGHQVWSVTEPGAATAGPAASERALAEPAADEASAPARPARSAERASAAAPPRPTSPDRLMQAVLRAAHREAGDTAVSALVPDAAVLRASAAAKRALWPLLRAMRRPGGRP